MKKAVVTIFVSILALVMLVACGSADTATDTRDVPEFSGVGSTNDSASAGQNAPAPDTSNDSSSATINDPEPPLANNFDASRVIAVFTREDGSGTRDAFVSLTGVGDDMYVEAVVENETNQILTKIEENEYAIGYASVGSLNPRVKALSIDGVAPSDATITDGSYVLQRPLLVCVNPDNENNTLVQDFISFMLSAEGQDISATKWTKIDKNAPVYASSGLSGTLKVGGSTSVEPLMQALSQAYISLNPSVDIEISGGGSGTGISEATSGVLNIGMSSRALKDSEIGGLKDFIIALDGVAVIINPANPLADISKDQIREIFVGEITRWSGVIG